MCVTRGMAVGPLLTALLPQGTAIQSLQSVRVDDSMTFHAPLVEDFRLSFDVTTASGEVIGKSFLHPSQLASRRGTVVAPLISPATLAPIGELRLRFLLILPFVHPNNIPFHAPFAKHRPSGLEVGHRGCGVTKSTVIGENSLLSFNTAAKFGATFVELDVQMTADLVPVVHHNFLAVTSNLNGTKLETPVSSLTLKQFKTVAPASGRDMLRNPNFGTRKASLKRALSDGSKRSSILPSGDRDTVNPYDSYPTLKQTLKSVPADVGFLVEIKYPAQWYQQQVHMSFHERNLFCDQILTRVFDMASHPTLGHRRCIFISFDPDIAMMMAHKQSRYPVMFLLDLSRLSKTTKSVSADISDPRTVSLEVAIKFALTNRIKGIITDIPSILSDPSVTERIHRAGLLHFTYGLLNSDTKAREQQKQIGVDTLIVDNFVGLHRPKAKLAGLRAQAGLSSQAGLATDGTTPQ